MPKVTKEIKGTGYHRGRPKHYEICDWEDTWPLSITHSRPDSDKYRPLWQDVAT